MEPALTTAAEVRHVQDEERQLIAKARSAVSECAWLVGGCAAEWTQRFARGRTDADFGELVGLDGQQVRQRRAVWETFSDVRDSYPCIKFSHFRAALNWDDAPEALAWANENQASVKEMTAWRRMQNGEDLTAPEDEDCDDPEPEFRTRVSNSSARRGPEDARRGSEARRGSPDPAADSTEGLPESAGSEAPRTTETEPKAEVPYVAHGKTKKNTPSGWLVDGGLTAVLTRVEALLASWSTARVQDAQREKSAAVLRRLATELTRKADELDPRGTTGAGRRFVPPTVEDVRGYCEQRNNGIDAEAFVDFYASCGWKVGNKPMKDWQAAVRTWEKRHGSNGNPVSGPRGFEQRRADPSRVHGTETPTMQQDDWLANA